MSRGTVRAKHIGKDLVAGLKSIVGGEATGYTKLQAEAREQALARMMEDAAKMGADAIVCVRLQTSMIADGMAEVVFYGTAVKLA